MTSSHCADPILAERILDETGRGEVPRGEHARHLEKCRPCSVEVERSRRISGSWQQIEPSRRELLAARATFLATRSRVRRTVALPTALVPAILLFGTLALANVIHRYAQRTEASTAAHSEAKPGPRAARTVEPARPEAAPRVTSVSSVAPSPVATTLPAVPFSSPVPRPRVAEPTRVVDTPAPRTMAPERTLGAVPTPASVDSPPPSAWAAVAEAMRAGDYTGAQRSLDELVHAEDTKTRDDARLARAQVWIAQRRTERARPELEDLATSGHTPLVRQRAAQALRMMTDSASSP
jgi:hypothetical protein